MKVDEKIELAIELERAYVLKEIKEVSIIFKKENPFVYGIQTACEELEYRFNEAWNTRTPESNHNG